MESCTYKGHALMILQSGPIKECNYYETAERIYCGLKVLTYSRENCKSQLVLTKSQLKISRYGFTIRNYGFTLRNYGFTIRNYGFAVRNYGFTVCNYGFAIRNYAFHNPWLRIHNPWLRINIHARELNEYSGHGSRPTYLKFVNVDLSTHGPKKDGPCKK